MKLPHPVRRLMRHYRRSTSSTVRYAFPALVVFAALFGAALSIASNPSYVRIESSPANVTAGQEFTISVYANAGVPTNAVDIQVAYPESQIAIDSVDTGESIITIWTEQPYAKNGTIHLRGGVFRRGFLGEHLIARAKARAIETGVAHILASDSQFVAGDGKGSAVPVVNTGAQETKVYVAQAGEIKSTLSIGIVTDIDGDGDVDLSDIRAFLSAWQENRSVFDFNGDGKMNFKDFGILLAYSFFR